MKASFKAEAQRTQMILHYERSQSQRNIEMQQESDWR